MLREDTRRAHRAAYIGRQPGFSLDVDGTGVEGDAAGPDRGAVGWLARGKLLQWADGRLAAAGPMLGQAVWPQQQVLVPPPWYWLQRL